MKPTGTAARTLFAADLHLCPIDTLQGTKSPEQQAALALALQFFDDARGAAALYLLGDLFDAWMGDDQLNDLTVDPDRLVSETDSVDDLERIVSQLRAVSASGTDLVLMHGNRDFLLGEQFATMVGGTLIRDDEYLIELHGKRTLLMHGDTLCTDDVAYQSIRTEMRSEAWQQGFLSLPASERRAQARALRSHSARALADKQASIMDVSTDSVVDRMRSTGCELLIHGHTHRPGYHEVSIDGTPQQRWVLGDWHPDHARYLCHDGEQLALLTCGATTQDFL